MCVNKVIRPKSRALALSKTVRQIDRQTIFFQQDILNSYLLLQASSPLYRDMKNTIKSLKTDFVTDKQTDGQMDGPMDGPTDQKVAYRVA